MQLCDAANGACLDLIHTGIAAAAGQQFFVGPALRDAPVFNDKNLIRATDGGQTVGNRNDGTAARDPGDGLLDLPFGFHIDRGGCFVQDDDRRLPQDCALLLISF